MQLIGEKKRETQTMSKCEIWKSSAGNRIPPTPKTAALWTYYLPRIWTALIVTAEICSIICGTLGYMFLLRGEAIYIFSICTHFLSYFMFSLVVLDTPLFTSSDLFKHPYFKKPWDSFLHHENVILHCLMAVLDLLKFRREYYKKS